MATIEKRGNSYRITVSAGYDITGKQLRQRMTWTPEQGMTKKQLEKELNKVSVNFEEKVKSGNYIDNRIKFADWCDEYLEIVKTKYAPRTWLSYKGDIDTRIKPALGHIKLSELNSIHIQHFVQMLQEKGQYNDQNYKAWEKRSEKLKAAGKPVPAAPEKKEYLSASTIRRIIAILQSILTAATKKHIISENPASTSRLELPKVESSEVQILNETDVDKVLTALDSEPLMYQVLVHLALNTGCRRGELIALKWENIDFNNGAVQIQHSAYKLKGKDETLKEPKRGSFRRIAIPKYLINMLHAYQKEQKLYQLGLGDRWQGDDWLFIQHNGKEMNITTPSHWWPDFLKRNNLKHVKFHSLRHTSGTLALKDGADIKAVASRLGHKKLSTTERYVHALSSADKAMADKFEKRYVKMKMKHRKKAPEVKV